MDKIKEAFAQGFQKEAGGMEKEAFNPLRAIRQTFNPGSSRYANRYARGAGEMGDDAVNKTVRGPDTSYAQNPTGADDLAISPDAPLANTPDGSYVDAGWGFNPVEGFQNLSPRAQQGIAGGTLLGGGVGIGSMLGGE